MGATAQRLSRTGYTRVVKPMLFRLSPDAVHEHLITTGGRVQRVRPLMRVVRHVLGYRDPILAQTVLGVPLANPVGLAAGLDKNVALPDLMRAVGFGFATFGSVTARPCDGNPRPWFHRLPAIGSLAVHVGLANQGSAAVRDRLDALAGTRSAGPDMPFVISVARTNDAFAADDAEGIEDYLHSLRAVDGRVPLVEINISCPNTWCGEPFTDPDRLDALLTRVDALGLHQPVLVKMPSDRSWPQFRALLDVLLAHDVAGVTVANLRKDRTGLDVPEEVRGNLSGRPLRELSTELVAATYRHCGDRLVIVGVGGVFTAEDAYAKIRAGASLVELVTGLIFEGPQVVGAVNRGLAELLRRDGFASVREAVGVGALVAAG
ncbi:quinone-dependent dihydroorotate dehydrogenase [Cellulomonas hominis]